MVETITPAVCGGRHRHRAAVALFAVGAILAAAALGAALGAVGSLLDRDAALVAVGALALVGALREAGWLRLPLPQVAHQVPERWRREWPLPLWSLGYGAGLGLGLITHQVVATFWIVAAGALALGDPLVSALVMAPFGLGRALMVALPARGRRDPAAAVERLARRRGVLRPANAVALAVLAGALAATPALAQAGASGTYDPAAWDGVVATTVSAAGSTPAVVVRPRGAPPVRFEGGHSPALDGDLLAYADDAGIRVVNWRTGQELLRLPGAPGELTKPAIDWPLVAYVRVAPRSQRLELFNAGNGRTRRYARTLGTSDLGRPALRNGVIAWHVAAGRHSEIRVARVARRGYRVLATSITGLQINPSIAAGRILWVEQAGSFSYLHIRRLRGGTVRTLASLRGPSRILWTTALASRTAYATRWNPITGRGELIARRWR
jgi:cytochrome c biogenesis protein CcdA